MKTEEIIPQLMRFYGGRPEDWLNLSTKDIRMFIENMEKIKARENLEMVEVLAYGFGVLDTARQRELYNEWCKRAKVGYGHDRTKLSKQQQAAILASMGVKLEWQKN